MEFRDSELIRKLVRQGLSGKGAGTPNAAGMKVASAPNGEGGNLPEHSPTPVGGDHGELVLISTGGRAHAHSQAPAGARRPLLIVIDGGKR